MTTCSCCGEEQNRHVALQCHDDIKICPGCIGWLRASAGVIDSTPILPVIDMAASVAFYRASGFEVREYGGGGLRRACAESALWGGRRAPCRSSLRVPANASEEVLAAEEVSFFRGRHRRDRQAALDVLGDRRGAGLVGALLKSCGSAHGTAPRRSPGGLRGCSIWSARPGADPTTAGPEAADGPDRVVVDQRCPSSLWSGLWARSGRGAHEGRLLSSGPGLSAAASSCSSRAGSPIRAGRR